MAQYGAASTSSGSGSTDGGTTEQAKEQVRQAGEQAGEQARQAQRKAGEQAREQYDRRSDQVGEQARSTAQAFRDTSKRLRESDQPGPAKIIDGVADRVERAGDYLKSSDADRVFDDVERFARRRPWAVAAGGLVLGLAAARVLRASSEQRFAGRGRSTGGQQEHRRPASSTAFEGGGSTGPRESSAGLPTPGSTSPGVTERPLERPVSGTPAPPLAQPAPSREGF